MIESEFGPECLALDAEAEVARIGTGIRQFLSSVRRKGVVVALSGGIDSSVVAALCARVIGKERVLGLLLPERESSSDTPRLGRMIADFLGIDTIVEDISPVLSSLGCYRRRDDAIRLVYPDFGPDCRAKIVLPSIVENEGFRLFSLIIQTPDGKSTTVRLTAESYLGIVAATNFKQRVRAVLCYHHADRLNYAVAGTPNRLEFDQGFFVKLGDGAADLKPIAHLYKTQVYQLASHLGVPEEIRSRAPTTDTYSLSQSQEEFYFSLPYGRMDLCLYGKNNGVPVEAVAAAVNLSEDQVRRIFRDIERKRESTEYLHLPPRVLFEVPEVAAHTFPLFR